MSQSSLEQNRIAKRYASALASVGVKAGFSKALSALSAAVKDHDNLYQALKSPLTQKESLVKVAGELCSHIKAPKEVEQLCALMGANRRLHLLPEVAAHYETLAADAAGEINAKIETATKLDKASATKISKALQSLTGKKVTLDATVNPALLAGFVVNVGASRLDYSLEGKLQALQAQLKANDNG